ncbi:MAG: lysophospholipid acyltransferase family protein [Phycisphaerae bacterium]|nr:lysophospholipid acyltransferase family protein [Phycisphaerae bacterium]
MTDDSNQTMPLAMGGTSPLRGGWIRTRSANFWREFMYWWTGRFPPAVLLTRPFFLFFAFRFSKALQDGPAANARRLLGPNASEREVESLRRNIIRSAYTSIYELGCAVRSNREALRSWVEEVEGKEHYLAARSARRGAIVVTAHLGPFEVGAAALMSRNERIHVVFQRDERASFEQLRSRLRALLGISESPIDRGWAIWGALRDALLANEVVLIQGDRVMPQQRGVPVAFHSGHMLMPTGPLKLAMLTGAPLVPVFCIRTNIKRCRVIIDEPIYVNPDRRAVDGRHPAMQRLANSIERQVLAHPEQWAIFEKAWCEDRRDEAGTSLKPP